MSPLCAFTVPAYISIHTLTQSHNSIYNSITHALLYHLTHRFNQKTDFSFLKEFLEIMTSKLEIRTVILYCFERGLTTTQVKNEIAALKGTKFASYATINVGTKNSGRRHGPQRQKTDWKISNRKHWHDSPISRKPTEL